MSLALYNTGGLRFWSEEEILRRNTAVQHLHLTVSKALTSLNPAWQFHQVEGPLITPSSYVNAAYDENDIWKLVSPIAGAEAVMRPETTASSYLYAVHLLKSGLAKAPLCVWQVGKSFRRETNDGASASKLRFNEFYQAEWQCIYREDTKANVRGHVLPLVASCIGRQCHASDLKIVDSDRLPDYSESTLDVEVPFQGKWKEIASVSIRKDFPLPGHKVLEIAVGMDRIIST